MSKGFRGTIVTVGLVALGSIFCMFWGIAMLPMDPGAIWLLGLVPIGAVAVFLLIAWLVNNH